VPFIFWGGANQQSNTLILEGVLLNGFKLRLTPGYFCSKQK